MDRIFFICLGVFLFLYGIMAATNVRIVWMEPICGLAALVAGFVCLMRAFKT